MTPIIENFQQWNEWYQAGQVKIGDLHTQKHLTNNSPVILSGLDAQVTGIVKGNVIMKPNAYRPCDIRPRNSEQEVALSLMNDPDIKLVVLSGVAGSGKTLLACAHAMEQLNNGTVMRVVITKSLTPVGRDIGYLKGDIRQKVQPWLGSFYDNFIHCGIPDYRIDSMIDSGQVEITPITYIQGRSISDAIILIDEIQNLELSVLKQIITRAGENTQIILVGDSTQSFEKLTAPGMSILVEKAQDTNLAATVDFKESVRSELAEWAVYNL